MIFAIVIVSLLIGKVLGFLVANYILKTKSSGSIAVIIDPDDNKPYFCLQFENASEINKVLNSEYVTLKIVKK